jgi:hypothetical protein
LTIVASILNCPVHGLDSGVHLSRGDEFGVDIAVDGTGNAYVTGYTFSSNFPTHNALQSAFGGLSDTFIAKLTAEGTGLIYSTYFGGSSFDLSSGIAADRAGNAYVTGGTSSADFPTHNALQPTFGDDRSGGDAFVAKLSAEGATLIYSTYLGGSDFDQGFSIAVDGKGDAYVTGRTGSTDFPTQNALQPTVGGGLADAFVTKIRDTVSTPTDAAQIDFNGDDRADVFWWNAFLTGETSAWLIDGGSVLEVTSYLNLSFASGWLPFSTGDLNADGRTDVFWWNLNTGETSAWLIDGGTILALTSYATVSLESGWFPIGFHDFNGDSKTDVFWRNQVTGDNSAWLIDGGTILESTSYPNVPPTSGWAIEGFGDFNADARTDVFWYNMLTGETSAWLIDGSTVLAFTLYATVPSDSGWSIKGFGDFNADGRTDVFWYNMLTGETSAWLIDGGTVLAFTLYTTMPPDSGWSIEGFGDFNADRRTDVFWRNEITGETLAWLIDGSTILASASYAIVSPTSGWSIERFDDFNGDGRTDVFWRNSITGDNSTWLIDGSQVLEFTRYPSVPPESGWSLIF